MRRTLFFRFLGIFGLLVLLVVGGMAALAFLLTQFFGGSGQNALLVWIAGCGLALALPVMAVVLAVRTFRGLTSPLADVISAADEVAAGDLGVRVAEHEQGEMGRLTRSFNRMARELQRADERRRNLTAEVAHELRTPLHILQGNLEGLIDGVYEPTAEQITSMLEETRGLSRLVDDLMTLSLAETGELNLVMETVDVAELLADVETSFSGQAAAAEIELTSSVDTPGAALELRGDAGRLDQVVSNLMVNALRHTPAGGQIDLRAGAAGGGVQIKVRDTGEGIAAEDLPNIFERFWRGDPSRSHAEGAGGGLGLAIARQLVEAHGGSIQAESTPGAGTTFTVWLPPTQLIEEDT